MKVEMKMAGLDGVLDALRALPPEKSVAVGVIDVRTLEIEHPEQVAARMKLPQGVTDRLLADAERTLQAARRAFVEALVENSAARD